MRDIHALRRDNLRALLEKKYKGRRRALLEALDIGQPNFLSRLLSGNKKTGKNVGSRLARRIEQVAGKPANWLDTDHSRTVAREPGAQYNAARELSLIDWPEVSGWLRSTPEDRQRGGGELVPCPMICGPATFALRVRGASMEPRFRENDLIFCDPDVVPRSGSFVIVQRAEDDEPVFRQLVIEGRRRYLKAINPAWPHPIEPLDSADVICATVIFHGEVLT